MGHCSGAAVADLPLHFATINACLRQALESLDLDMNPRMAACLCAPADDITLNFDRTGGLNMEVSRR